MRVIGCTLWQRRIARADRRMVYRCGRATHPALVGLGRGSERGNLYNIMQMRVHRTVVGGWMGEWVDGAACMQLTMLPHTRTHTHTPAQLDVNHPLQWPNSAQFVPSRTQATIVVKPTFSYTVSAVYALPVQDRECLFPVSIRHALRFNLARKSGHTH